MGANTELYLYGSLRKTAGKDEETVICLDLEDPTPLLEVLRRLDILQEHVQLTMVNHKEVSKDSTVRPGDRLALFPKEYPLFADWKDFRF